MDSKYDKAAFAISRLITQRYSTSFSLGIRAFAPEYREPIYAVYGFVRFADEIVDSFHEYNKSALLKHFTEDTFIAIADKVSLNPVLHSFQKTVNDYQIDLDLIRRFLHSMEMDLEQKYYDKSQFDEYVLGSAEVVGLMCLKIFCHLDEINYQKLKPLAMHLGSAYQKVNFLRDLRADYFTLGRSYFPNINLAAFSDKDKLIIVQDIENEFKLSYTGIMQLPKSVRYGVLLSYYYYLALLRKINRTPATRIMQQRIRVNDWMKVWMFLKIIILMNFSLNDKTQ
jgi:15-cis-phytoene synthase